jgi:hypothetical protein
VKVFCENLNVTLSPFCMNFSQVFLQALTAPALWQFAGLLSRCGGVALQTMAAFCVSGVF